MLAAEETVKELQPIHDELNGIHWKERREKFAADHKDELEKFNKAKRLLHKFGLTPPLDRKQLRAEKAQLEQEIEELRPELNATQAEMDELKTVRYWVRKVIPDALPSRTESGATSLRNTLEVSQNENELNDLLERTAKQVISPQPHEVQHDQHRQNKTL